MICRKCERDLPDDQFTWDDGILSGTTTRCAECRSKRRGCPDCVALWNGRHYSRSARPPRCEACRDEARLPGLPLERFRIKSHALVRYQQRVRPDLTHRSDVLHEMLRLMEPAPLSEEAPPWYTSADPNSETARFGRGYLLVAAGVVFCLSAYAGRTKVATVLTADWYEAPPAAPEPIWVACEEQGYLTRIALKRVYEARQARSEPSL